MQRRDDATIQSACKSLEPVTDMRDKPLQLIAYVLYVQ